MRRFSIYFLSIASLALFSGCISYTHDYIVENSRLHENSERVRFPVTFSVFDEGSFRGAASMETVKKIRRMLLETNLFSSARYTEEPESESYHLHFCLWHSGPSKGEVLAMVNISICTLGIIPMGSESGLDGSLEVILRGKKVTGFACGERTSFVIWLPFLPLSFSVFSASEEKEQKVLRSLIGEFLNYHKSHFREGFLR